MDLEKIINSVRSEVAKRFDLKTDAEIDAFFIGMEESAMDNQEALEKRDKMLRDTVAELCEAKRLLKAAVDDVRYCMRSYDPCEVCDLLEENGECAAADDNDCSEKYKWRCESEALALIGEDTNVGHKSGDWISCKDRLPEPDTMVIVASYGSDIVIPEDGETVEECCKRLKKERVRVTLGFIGSDGWYGSDHFPLFVTPSFWQPLPEAPKDGERE